MVGKKLPTNHPNRLALNLAFHVIPEEPVVRKFENPSRSWPEAEEVGTRLD